MSTSKKLIVALVLLILLIGGWAFINKSGQQDSQMPEATAEVTTQTEETQTDPHEGHDHSHASTTSSAVEVGTETDLPTDPVLGVRGVGNPDAPVQIREYFSLTCNHCAAFRTGTYQELKTKYIDTGKVYFIHEEFPLNGPALYGSKIARCLPEDRYDGFIDILLRNQDQWAFSGDFKESLRQNAKLAGMSDEDFDACFDNEELQQAIAAGIKAAMDAWKITSTPTFVVNNGQRIIRGGQPIATFDEVIEQLMADSGATTTEAPVSETMEEAAEAIEEEVNEAVETAIEAAEEEPADIEE